jgi:hypothetical protein
MPCVVDVDSAERVFHALACRSLAGENLELALLTVQVTRVN